jgi:glycosyltransferase involved in cell wall biosynthesis
MKFYQNVAGPEFRITINAASHLHGGGLTYLKNILDAWRRTSVHQKHHVQIFLRPEGHVLLRDVLRGEFDVREVLRQGGGIVRKTLWENTKLPFELFRTKADVLWCPLGTAPMWSPAPFVMVMHNAGPFCDAVRLKSVGMRDWLWYRAFGVQMRAGARTAARVIFLSHYLRDIFVKTYGFSEERGDVIYNGPERHGPETITVLPAALQDISSYALCVGHLYPHKNLPALLEGFGLALRKRPDSELHLVIAGKAVSERYGELLKHRVRELGLSDRIVFVGMLSKSELLATQRRCEFFVFQSMCENCPISLLEALAEGLPILCSKGSVMPEICGDAAVYYDPNRPEDVCRGFLQILDHAETLPQLALRSRARAKHFPSWDEVAKQTLRVLEDIARTEDGTSGSGAQGAEIKSS